MTHTHTHTTIAKVWTKKYIKHIKQFLFFWGARLYIVSFGIFLNTSQFEIFFKSFQSHHGLICSPRENNVEGILCLFYKICAPEIIWERKFWYLVVSLVKFCWCGPSAETILAHKGNKIHNFVKINSAKVCGSLFWKTLEMKKKVFFGAVAKFSNLV